MAGLVLAIAASLLQSWLIRLDFFLDQPGLALLAPPLDFVWGPLLYLYAQSLTSAPRKGRLWPHFLPALAIFLLTNITYAELNPQEQRQFLAYLWSDRNDSALQEIYQSWRPSLWGLWVDYHLQGTLFTLHFGAYCLLVLRQIKQHNQRLQRHFSSLERMNLKWLQGLTLACLLFLLLFLLLNRSLLLTVGHFDVNALRAISPFFLLVVLIYAVGISALFQPGLVRGVMAARESDPGSSKQPSREDIGSELAETESPEQSTETDSQKSPKYARAQIPIEDANRFKSRLMSVMQERQLYLNCDLTLPELARETDMTTHQVSQVINGQLNQNFFSFVNNYRIQMAKDMMASPETCNMPIVELAVEVGFKSKSSFYDAFKKTTQMTPTQFKKSLES